jgi:hypothetical protein
MSTFFNPRFYVVDWFGFRGARFQDIVEWDEAEVDADWDNNLSL